MANVCALALNNMEKNQENIPSVGAAIALAVVVAATGRRKKICRKNRLQGTARPCWPRFYGAIRETFTIALTVPDGRTRFSIIFRGAFY